MTFLRVLQFPLSRRLPLLFGRFLLVAFSLGLRLIHAADSQPSQSVDSAEALAPSVVLGEASPGPATPAAFTPLTEDRFGPGLVQRAGDLTGLVPTFVGFQSGNERVPRFSIRGLRENNFMAGEPVLSLYVDDVPFDTHYSRGIPLMGVASAELWRGPQPTVFGANRPGGVLNIHSPVPDNLWQGYGALSYGNYNAVDAEAGISAPILTNTLFAGFNGLFEQRDGYVYNTVTERHSDTREALSGRGLIRWAPLERLDVRFTLSGYQFDDGMLPGNFLGQDLFTVSRNVDGYDHQNSHTEALRISYAGDSVAVLSVTAHTAWRESVLQDGDLTPANFLTTDITRDAGTWSQELRFESSDAEAILRWRAGGFFSDTRLDSDSAQIYSFIPGQSLVQQTVGREEGDNYALFGEGTFGLGKFELTGGLRLDYATRATTAENTDPLGALQGGPLNSSSQGDRSFNSLEPKVALTYKLDDRTRIWASVTRGFQPGGFRLSISPNLPEFQDSDSWHFEVGTRWASDGEIVTLSAIGFFDYIHDYQVLRPTSLGSFTVVNADRAHTFGLELEAVGRPLSTVELRAGAGVLQAKFDDFIDPDTGYDFSGRSINFVPDFTLDASATWHPVAGWFLRVGAQILGSFWLDEGNTHEQGSYTLLEARAGYQAKHWGIAAFGRNLLDEHYIANALQFRQPGIGDIFVVVPGDPRLYGVQLSASF